MAKKVRIELSYAREKLWWSADAGVNWGIVGPESPVTLLDKDSDITWIADDTISDITISIKTDKVLDKPEGSKKEKKCKVKKGCKNGDKSKYDITIVVAKNQETITFDPDTVYCDPMKPECLQTND